jgi:hypothetical protein
MIKVEFIFKGLLELTNTNMNVVYKAYVNKRYYKELNLNVYTPFPIKKLLNAKSISFKKISYEEYRLNNGF